MNTKKKNTTEYTALLETAKQATEPLECAQLYAKALEIKWLDNGEIPFNSKDEKHKAPPIILKVLDDLASNPQAIFRISIAQRHFLGCEIHSFRSSFSGVYRERFEILTDKLLALSDEEMTWIRKREVAESSQEFTSLKAVYVIRRKIAGARNSTPDYELGDIFLEPLARRMFWTIMYNKR